VSILYLLDEQLALAMRSCSDLRPGTVRDISGLGVIDQRCTPQMPPLLSVRGLTLRRDDGEGSAILNVSDTPVKVL
jgi:hypothetical protein